MNTPDDPTLDERLARLAPSASPDPDRLAAARAALDAATALHPDDAGGGHDRRSSVEGGAHVLDLDPHDGHVEVVTPLDAASRARDRRRRRVTLAAASVGVLGVVGTALVLSPVGPNFAPASPERACAAQTESGLPHGTGAMSWHVVEREVQADRSLEESTLVMLLEDDERLAVFCAEPTDSDGSTSSSVTWPVPSTRVDDDAVIPLGVHDDEWYVVWGRAGADVGSVTMNLDWPRSETGGAVREAGGLGVGRPTTPDGYWALFVSGDQVPPDAGLTLEWGLTDGTTRTTEVGDAWDVGEEGDVVSASVAQRRDACAQGWDDGTSRPVIEERRDDHGAALFEVVRTGGLVFCVQGAEPPYREVLRTSGTPAESAAPAADEAGALVGGGSGPSAALAGRAGADVERVEVRTADGARLAADVVDGYWLAWSTSGPESGDRWGDATLTWFLHDGSKGGSKRVFE